MRLNVTIEDNHIKNKFDLPNGIYDIELKPKGEAKTYEQVKKLWATIDDISKHEYGDSSQSTNIYFQILAMAGIRTDKLLIPAEAYKDLKKKVRAISIVSNEVINHIPHYIVQVCLTGISDMNKQEVSSVIETAIKWCSELGIETELER